MNKGEQNKQIVIRTIILCLFVCFTLVIYSYSQLNKQSKYSGAKESVEFSDLTEPVLQKKKYSDFPHSKHRQACSSCHKFPSSNWKRVRKADQAFPDITDYPKHQSCLNCHRRQFFGSSRPQICTICHKSPSPRNSTRHPFPNPREIYDLSAKGKNAVSDFAISFPHSTHTDIVSQNVDSNDRKQTQKSSFIKVGFKRLAEESCSVCHKTYQPQGESDEEYFSTPPKNLGDSFWLKKGTFKTVPLGHTNCFTCHSKETGMTPFPSNCGACHKLKTKPPQTDFSPKVAAPMKIRDKVLLTAWRKRDSSATFRHEFSSHADMDCSTCHNVAEMNTLKSSTKKVSISSCSICHTTATSDDGGILNYEVDSRKKDAKFQCVKCHIAFGKLAIPVSHIKAIEAQAEN